MNMRSWLPQSRLSGEQQLLFLRDFAQWLGDGQSADSALRGMEILAAEQRQQQYLSVIKQMRKALAQGKSIAFGMQAYFSQELRMLVEVGQQAGCLSELIDRYQDFRHRRQQLIAQCKQGLLYPLMLLSASVLAIVFVGSQIVPRFLQMDSISSPPSLVVGLQHTANLFITIIPVLLVAVVVVITFFKLGILAWHRQGQLLLPNILPSALFRIYTGVYLLQGLSLLMATQLSLEQSLRMFEQNAGNYLQWHIQAMRKALARGEIGLHKVFATGLLSTTSLFRMQASVAQQQPHRVTLEQLSLRMAQDGEQLLRFHQRAVVRSCYVIAAIFIVWLVLAMGQLFTLIAQQLR